MTTFLIGLAILLVAGWGYGKYCQHVFGPDDRKTPAIAKEDGVDYVPMPKWKNSLIQLLNIAGTGPILGPIQGILFGPIAFILIPLGCVFGGAMHDYFSGMISMREGGEQMPGLVRKYLGKGVFAFYNIFLCLLLLLVVAVFVTTPGDLVVTQLLNKQAIVSNPLVWIVCQGLSAHQFVARQLEGNLSGRYASLAGVFCNSGMRHRIRFPFHAVHVDRPKRAPRKRRTHHVFQHDAVGRFYRHDLGRRRHGRVHSVCGYNC